MKIKGNGNFLCPCCKVLISPDDETEQVYTISEAIVEKDKLESWLIMCNNCSAKFCLLVFLF